MGLLEWLTGWEYVGNTINNTVEVNGKYYLDPKKSINHIHPKIINKLKKSVDRDLSKQMNRWHKRNRGRSPFGRTMRGVKVQPNLIGIGYARGKTFFYKAKEDYTFIDNHGHGGAVSSGMKVWRKLREDKLRN